MKEETFELTNENKLTILFYKNVKNIQEIKKSKFNASFINASLVRRIGKKLKKKKKKKIVSMYQILVSSYK